MFPNIEKVSYIALLSILLSRFFIKMFPAPERRIEGSRCDHIIRMGLPNTVSKFMVSRARSAINVHYCHKALTTESNKEAGRYGLYKINCHEKISCKTVTDNIQKYDLINKTFSCKRVPENDKKHNHQVLTIRLLLKVHIGVAK